jgi:hypothetical protein
MELNDYPHFDLAEDGRLCSMGQHCPGFLRVLYDALIHHGYDGDAPVYRCRLSRVHDLDRCEVSVTIPFDPARPWSGSIIDNEPDTSNEMMAHIMGILPRAPGGFRFLFVTIDTFTKWMEAMPVVNITQDAAVRFLQSIIYMFIVPKWVLTDIGTQFKGAKFAWCCSDFGINHQASLAAHPQTYG